MQFEPNSKKVVIGVEELCHAVVNYASIDARGVRIYEGSDKIAEAYTAKYGTNYAEDIPVCRTVSRGGLFYTVSGNCDGVLHMDGGTTVCINRSVSGDTARLTADDTAETVAVAAAYAYLVAEAEAIGEIRFRITFRHTQNDIYTIEKKFSRRDLSDAFLRLVDLHRPFAALEAERVCVRLPAAKAQSFPYREMRKQQRDFMIEVLRAVKNGGKAMIEAPTGTGKTMAALFPALKALGCGYVDKIFYFTSKNTTALAALQAAKKLSEGCGIRAIHVTAKDRCCPIRVKDPFKCTPEKCPRAKGHYKRTADAITDIVTMHKVIDTAALNEYAAKYSICPYEFSLDLTEHCDLVICDYNYLIDETAYFRRYFSESGTARPHYLFLFDEAHNLLERAKTSFGAELRLSQIRRFLDAVRGASQNAVVESLSNLEFYMNSMRALCAEDGETDEDGKMKGFTTLNTFDKTFYDLLVAFTRAADRFIRSPLYQTLPESLSDLCADAKKYLTAMEGFDECFVETVTVFGDEVVTKILCLDPAKRLAQKTEKGTASIFFSATLTPLDYYASLYGASDAVLLKLDCPYDRSNACICIMDKLSVKYQYRSQNSSAVAEAIYTAVSRKDGNYIVYFPSYAYMSEVQTLFKYKYPYIRTVAQEKSMSESARRAFLDAFGTGSRPTLVGFCVLGGIYSEGIDLVGDRLIGSIIVGVGLIQPSNESEVLRAYYDNKYELGREYAYMYPGFNRVLQAAGRVIRSETDRGVVLFIDERYADPAYKELFPSQFRRARFVGDVRALESVLDGFWQNSAPDHRVPGSE